MHCIHRMCVLFGEGICAIPIGIGGIDVDLGHLCVVLYKPCMSVYVGVYVISITRYEYQLKIESAASMHRHGRTMDVNEI